MLGVAKKERKEGRADDCPSLTDRPPAEPEQVKPCRLGHPPNVSMLGNGDAAVYDSSYAVTQRCLGRQLHLARPRENPESSLK